MKYPAEFLEGLYRTMLRIRLCEESFIELILSGEVRTPCHLYSGQEAVATGICAALHWDDYIFGNHRSHGHYLAKGCNLPELVAEMYCYATGCSRGRGGSMHLISPEKGMMGAAPIVAGTISLAMGAALAASIRRDDRVAVSFFGDGATGEGVLYECLNFAALKRLPIIFVCENNSYATHMPIRECRVETNLYKIGAPFGVKSHLVDGNDVLAVYEVAENAAARCRRGEGPVLIECITYRFRGHVGPDDNIQGAHTDIRPREEFESWIKRDPIKLLEELLLNAGFFDRQELDAVIDETEREIAEAHLFAQNSTRPDRKDLARYVFR